MRLIFNFEEPKAGEFAEIHFLLLAADDSRIISQTIGPINYLQEYQIRTSADFKIRLMRSGHTLYDTERSSHEYIARLECIILDDFWEIGPKNMINNVVYDKEYIKHVGKYGQGWELKNTENCRDFYFNGYLEFNIKMPVCRNFYT